jgi:hypothetical protein
MPYNLEEGISCKSACTWRNKKMWILLRGRLDQPYFLGVCGSGCYVDTWLT